MYANPILLPQFSNREDLLLILSVFDDDTGNAVNLSGCIGSGTFSSWNVVDGAIATTSNTTLTIPTPPIGNQLSALALTVGAGLGIAAGDPITITDGITGTNSMTGYVLSYASASGALVVQIGMTFQFEIRRPANSAALSNGYGYASSFGAYDNDVPEVIASLANYITIVDVGYIQVLIPESVTKTLSPGIRRVSLTATDSVNTRQLFVGQLPMISGGVTN